MWRPVCAFPDYEVNSFGDVRNAQTGRALRQRGTKYPTVWLYRDRKAFARSVHVLVAEAFIGPKPSPLHEVNHKDGVKSNPHVGNLEWVTKREQTLHAYRLGLRQPTRGERQGGSRLRVSDVLEVRRLAGTVSQSTLARRFGVAQSTIADVVCRRTWAHVS